jgi:hypothetical protein
MASKHHINVRIGREQGRCIGCKRRIVWGERCEDCKRELAARRRRKPR